MKRNVIAFDEAIQALRGLSNGAQTRGAEGRKPRTMSASARARIAAAQRLRWAKWKKAQRAARFYVTYIQLPCTAWYNKFLVAASDRVVV